jgi:hypothetical protein
MVSVKLLTIDVCSVHARATPTRERVTCRSTQCISACIRAVRHAHMHIARRPTMFMCAWVEERINSHAVVPAMPKCNEKAGAMSRHSKGGGANHDKSTPNLTITRVIYGRPSLDFWRRPISLSFDLARLFLSGGRSRVRTAADQVALLGIRRTIIFYYFWLSVNSVFNWYRLFVNGNGQNYSNS